MSSTSEIGKKFGGLKGSDRDKSRAAAIVGAVAGLEPARKAAEGSGLGGSRFHELCSRFLQGGLDAISPRQAGRPRRVETRPADAGHLESATQLMLASMRMLALTLGYTPTPTVSGEPASQLHAAIAALEAAVQVVFARAQGTAAASVDPKTGRLLQDEHLEEQSATRLRFLELAWALRDSGLAVEEIAHGSGVPAATLREWNRKTADDEIGSPRHGRPAVEVDLRTRQAICEAMALLGPRVSIKALKRLFPLVPKRFLARMRRRFRRVYQRRGRIGALSLLWIRPRTVWGIDGLDPPADIGGDCTKALIVRDLASGRVLANQAVSAEDTASAVALLGRLFAELGPPLVLKADNGSGFSNDEVRALCARWRVVILYSPPHSPWYQGHIETGMSAVRDAVDEIVARAGRIGRWTQADLDLARIELNQNPKVAHAGKSPAQAWRQSPAISTEERECFYARYSAKSSGNAVDPALERSVIQTVLVESGLLEITTRSIPRRKPKQGLVRHVAGRLADLAKALAKRFDEICAALRTLLGTDAPRPLAPLAIAC